MTTFDANSRVYQCSDKTYKPSSNGASNPKPVDTFSVFREGSCGEPLAPQHLVLDFTPNDGDIDIIQKKVCSFWKFINNSPEIQNLKVKPERQWYTEDSKTDMTPSSKDFKSKVSSVVECRDKKALDILKIVEEKDMLRSGAKLPLCVETLGALEFEQSEVLTLPKKKEKKRHVCKCSQCLHPKCRTKKAPSTSSEELTPIRILTRNMNEWDAQHPKSMEPPGHPAVLQHCIIDRSQAFPAPL